MLRLRGEDRCALLAASLSMTMGSGKVIHMREFTKFVALQVLRGYKWAISPLFPPACRYVPTCSEYAMEAVERFGVMRGGWMALMRLLRCHPFSRGGYDPVVSPVIGGTREFGRDASTARKGRFALLPSSLSMTVRKE